MQRVLIIGPCGAGKSTLAFELGTRLDLPVFHMDKLNWRPGWVEGGKDEIRRQLAQIVAGDRWLIDGNYGGTLSERLTRADTVVYLDFPIILCVARVLHRIRKYHGLTRPDMTENCPERFNFEFLIYLLQWKIGPRPRTEAKLKGHEKMVIRLKSPAALRRWISTVPVPVEAGIISDLRG